jgi:16S rRNA (adenine1518-N6/adenine1519-N6)-dimethyltransferase
VRARKRFGQHFLERAWVDKVIRAIAPRPADVFLEIGPGRGALTLPLAAACGHVIAFEIDRDLARSLSEAAPASMTIVQADFLRLTEAMLRGALSGAGVPSDSGTLIRVAGNLPYNIASPILFRLADLHRAGVALDDATVMVQREVADRLVAEPGSKEYGVLSVLIRHGAEVERLLALPPGAFRPQPKVDSTLIRLRFVPDRPPVRNRAVFHALVQAVFSRRRKTLSNALLAFKPGGKSAIETALSRTGIDGRRRPETLQIAEFAALADAFETA